jgi:hypothetical protein
VRGPIIRIPNATGAAPWPVWNGSLRRHGSAAPASLCSSSTALAQAVGNGASRGHGWLYQHVVAIEQPQLARVEPPHRKANAQPTILAALWTSTMRGRSVRRGAETISGGDHHRGDRGAHSGEATMSRMLKTTALLLLVLIGAGLATPAAAAAIGELFRFTETSSTPSGVVTATGDLALTQAAFAAGVSINRNATNGPLNNTLTGTGILFLDFSVTGGSATLTAVDNASHTDFVPAGSGSFGGPLWNVNLTSAPNGIPTGLVSFNDVFQDFVFNLGNPASNGGFNTDNPAGGPCAFTGVCHFAGTWVDAGPIGAPEPASWVLVGIGLGGLGLIRRRKIG